MIYNLFPGETGGVFILWPDSQMRELTQIYHNIFCWPDKDRVAEFILCWNILAKSHCKQKLLMNSKRLAKVINDSD